jgi:two-component system alkaline phosphatase synthesis response regulator PhoP
MFDAQFILIERVMSGKKILIVDDSKIVLQALSMKLTGCGYEVLTAEDGSAAVRLARHEQPHLILLDVSFPPDVAHGGGVGWDGFLVMDWLRRMDEARGIPVFIISGGDPVVYAPRALAAGALHYFQKPINNEELLGAIQSVLGPGNDPQ